MNPVIEAPVRTGEFLDAAVVIERQAAECLVALQSHFELREMPVLAMLCRELATRHVESLASLSEAGAQPAPVQPWMEAPAQEFVLRMATPRQLLELARATEQGAVRFYDQGPRQGRTPTLAVRLASRARENERRLALAMEGAHGAPDWERLIEMGAVPALALGAERRLHRQPR